MKKILLSAAALAVFLNAAPANALFSGSKTEMTTTLGSDYATKLTYADAYANNIKSLLPQLYTAVQNDGMSAVINLAVLKEAVTERTIGTSGYLMKYIKKVAELGSNLKNAKSVSTLQTRKNEILKDGRQTQSIDLLKGICNILIQNPTQFGNTRNVMMQIAQNAYRAMIDLSNITSGAINKSTTVYAYLQVLLSEYINIYNAASGNSVVYQSSVVETPTSTAVSPVVSAGTTASSYTLNSNPELNTVSSPVVTTVAVPYTTAPISTTTGVQQLTTDSNSSTLSMPNQVTYTTAPISTTIGVQQLTTDSNSSTLSTPDPVTYTSVPVSTVTDTSVVPVSQPSTDTVIKTVTTKKKKKKTASVLGH